MYGYTSSMHSVDEAVADLSPWGYFTKWKHKHHNTKHSSHIPCYQGHDMDAEKTKYMFALCYNAW
jgi:hypothetical protein